MGLNKGQKKALQALKSGKNVFLSGDAGTGKSYVLNQFLDQVPDKNVIVCAPTGIAAINVNGSTLHRVFKVPIEPLPPTINPKKSLEAVEKADIIIIDEISMCRFDCFEYVTKSIKFAEKKAQEKENKRAAEIGVRARILPSKQLIVVGDFFQLPPVINDKDRKVLENYWGKILDIGDGFAFQAPMWREFNFEKVVLDEVIRQKDDFEFVTNLNKIRRGDVSGIAWFNENAAKKRQSSISLCSTKKAADQINSQEIAKIKRKGRIYVANSTGSITDSDKMTLDHLELKEGMQVMALINDPEERYQNGTIGTVKKLHPHSVDVDFGDLVPVEITPNRWEITDYRIVKNEDGTKVEKVIVGTFEQLPLKVAYAITIHKSQGQTYEAANIAPSCFASGQLYVALSRVKSIKNLYLIAQIQPSNLITSQAVLDFYGQNIDNIDVKKNKNVTKSMHSHGGSRSGAGRKKKYGTKTCTIRIPVSAKEAVLDFLASRDWN